MQDYGQAFMGKKITVMGLGTLGRGVGDAKFLAEMGAELIVTDLKSAEELSASLEILKTFPNITYRLGGHDLADFSERDYILKAAGVPADSPYITEAEKNGIPVKMSTSWFLELSGVRSAGVTGTRGKSTVTHLLYAIVKHAGKEVLLGGNVRGVSTLALLPEVREDTIAVLELDSWQCQGLRDAKLSPSVAVFTTLYADHMNYYPDMDSYLDDKAQIFLHQKTGDTLVLGLPVVDTVLNAYGPDIRAHVVVANPAHFPDHWKIRIPGAHNLLNAACAIEAARALGIADDDIQDAVAEFSGVAGRLEPLGLLSGVEVYNDTTATTPEATVAALRAVPAGNIVLIMGGADKGLDMSELASLIPAYTKKVILLSGNGTEKLVQDFPDVFKDAPTFDSLDEAFTAAREAASAGDSILLSPAFASFGMFKNEFDRGDRFAALFTKLAHER